jgi:hypothetical protein
MIPVMMRDCHNTTTYAEKIITNKFKIRLL